MTNATAIRRRPDGSIDTDFYVAKGRLQRSIAAHSSARSVTKKSGKALVLLAILGVSAFFRGGQV